jgi:predicted DCC family thiol-disulfide oxidoreductase YuxK
MVMDSNKEVLVVYDKECPACDYYCNLVRIRESVGRLVLVNARDAGPVMDEITAKGFDIDQGMVVKVGNGLYYGADAINALALMALTRDSSTEWRTGRFVRPPCQSNLSAVEGVS